MLHAQMYLLNFSTESQLNLLPYMLKETPHLNKHLSCLDARVKAKEMVINA